MKNIYRWITFSILSRVRGAKFCFLYNYVMRINGRRSRCRFSDGLYELSDEVDTLFFTRATRYRYYSEGIHHRLSDLFFQYVGDRFEIREGDVVVDCGANIGEFSIFCLSRGANVFSFEPDPTEFSALRRNLGEDGRAYPFALWFQNESLSFDLQNDTGDSSVSQGAKLDDFFMVEGRRLDSFKELSEVPRVRLLKLEAEGFEPEVLRGSVGLLPKIEYIAADLGPERGDTNESSLPEVVNFMQANGFSVSRFFAGRSIVLFENISLCSGAAGEEE